MQNTIFEPEYIEGRYNSSYKYDAAGNITELRRYGVKHYNDDNEPQFGLVDDLTYSYNGDGQLNSINNSSAASISQGFPGQSSSFNYDSKGNMLTASHRELSIQYNPLNLPRVITSDNGQEEISYFSGAASKFKNEVLLDDQTVTRYHVGGFEFEVDSDDAEIIHPRFYNFGDGRIIFDEPEVASELDTVPVKSQDPYIARFQYYLKDHLGNTMVIYEDKDKDLLIKPEDQEHAYDVVGRFMYYPFGMKWEDVWPLGFNPDIEEENRHLYNSKELHRGSGLYDYGFRYYMAEIGRFTGVDPLAGEMPSWSPYNYTFNNPIRFIDPDGRAPDDYYKTKSGNIVWRNSTESTLMENGQELTNIGSSYASFNGSYMAYHYQIGSEGNLSPAHISLAAVSGRPNANGDFDYSLDRQMKGDVGPIPAGEYTMNLDEAPNMTTYRNFEGIIGGAMGAVGLGKRGLFPGGRTSWGDGRIGIDPKSVNVGGVIRQGFTIHGGSSPGSAGCIDMCGGFSLFKSTIEQHKGSSSQIYLEVKYKSVRPIKSSFE